MPPLGLHKYNLYVGKVSVLVLYKLIFQTVVWRISCCCCCCCSCCPYLLVYPVNTLQHTSLSSQNMDEETCQESSAAVQVYTPYPKRSSWKLLLLLFCTFEEFIPHTYLSWSSALNVQRKFPPNTSESTGVKTAWIHPNKIENKVYLKNKMLNVYNGQYTQLHLHVATNKQIFQTNVIGLKISNGRSWTDKELN